MPATLQSLQFLLTKLGGHLMRARVEALEAIIS